MRKSSEFMRTQRSPAARFPLSPPGTSRSRGRLQRVAFYSLIGAVIYYTYFIFTHKPHAHPHTIDRHEFAGTTGQGLISACSSELPGKASKTRDGRARVELYDRLGADVFKKGLPALTGTAASSQGMQVSDLFTFQGQRVTPVLHPLEVPVRAIVVPIDASIGHQLNQESQRLLSLVVRPGDIWYQDPELFHSSLWHASHHVDPQPAGRAEVAAEVATVRQMATHACPIQATLERVVLTAGGVLMACWQVKEGSSEPSDLRKELRDLLPRSPVKQLVSEPVILHTTIARALRLPAELAAGDGSAAVDALTRVAQQLTERFCGMSVSLDTLWFIEEHHTLALALGGNVTTHPLAMECPTE